MPARTKPQPTSSSSGRLRTLVLLVLALTVLVLAGCGDRGGNARTMGGSPDELLPGASARDWATFADHLITVHLVGQKATPQGYLSPGERDGVIGRVVTLAVDDVLWSRDSAARLPDRLRWQAGGWSVEDGGRVVINVRGGPRIVSGHEFLVAVVHVRGEWGPLTSENIYAYDDGQIGKGPDRIGPPVGPDWVNEYRGDSADALVKELKHKPPYREAESLMKAGVVKRLQATQNP